VRSRLLAWIADERGQDLIEYALLGSFIGFATVAGVAAVGTALANAYTNWDAAVQSDALVEVPDPQ
jgi:Flp pilus assembly pilin Flp